MSDDPHPSSADIARRSVTELGDAFSRGDVSSVEVVSALLDRIDALDASGPRLGSVAALSVDALDEATRRDDERRRGLVRGPLHGIPVLVKDNIEVRGLPAAAGSTALAAPATRDADVVAALRRAGAVVMGTTNLSQWANIRSPNSTSGYSARGGLVANPWALDRSAGGSSSGSGAALAARLAPLVLGTETDGSIVCPASLNGVMGLKPTVGATSRRGVVPISGSQDSPGPLARSVGDLAVALEALGVATSHPHAPRLVVATSWRSAHRATDALFDQTVEALREAGRRVDERDSSLPGSEEFDDELTVLLCELKDDLDAYLSERTDAEVRSLAEVIDFEERHADVEMRYFGHEFLERALASGGRASEAYGRARERNLRWARERALDPLLEDHDVILAPAYGPAWKSDLVNGDNAKYVAASVMAAAIAGWPIACVPMGLVEGLPVGLTLTGRPGTEGLLLEAARQVEAVGLSHWGVLTPTWRAATRG